jgi:hypothetical protein
LAIQHGLTAAEVATAAVEVVMAAAVTPVGEAMPAADIISAAAVVPLNT